MEVVDIMAEGGEAASEAASEGDTIGRAIPATSVGRLDTGPWTARDQVTQAPHLRT